MGGGFPIVIQSMTNTETSDVQATFEQVKGLYEAGSEIVRITVNNLEAARAVPKIKSKLVNAGLDIPLVGCFHYNGHTLLSEVPDCADALDKYRINPGNVGFGKKRNEQFATMVEKAIEHNKPIRIGVNWGSLDQALLADLMNENAKLVNPQSSTEVMRMALVESTISSAKFAVSIGLPKNMIVLSCKVSAVQDLIEVYTALATRTNYPLHLGLTEAGMGDKGVVATTAALAILLQQGIGDTIRASLTPVPGEGRTKEVKVCQEVLQALGLRSFKPQITACPGCGRTTSDYFQKLASEIDSYIVQQMPKWQEKYPGVEELKIAVMGCIVNGPGESKHADIGISLPGTGESPVAPVFIDGNKFATLRGDNIAAEFKSILDEYIAKKFSVAK